MADIGDEDLVLECAREAGRESVGAWVVVGGEEELEDAVALGCGAAGEHELVAAVEGGCAFELDRTAGEE